VCLTGVALTVIVFDIKERRWKRSISIYDTQNSQRRFLRFVKLTSCLFYPFVVSDKVDFIMGIAGHNIFIETL
jgi:hypothetical protein